MKKLDDYRTRTLSEAEYTLYIEARDLSIGYKVSYNTWLVKQFSYELDNHQETIIDNWVKERVEQSSGLIYEWWLEPVKKK